MGGRHRPQKVVSLHIRGERYRPAKSELPLHSAVDIGRPFHLVLVVLPYRGVPPTLFTTGTQACDDG
jgi:hypothetical protein